ncbi:hypothetical protein TNCT_117871 [Trichonephila clavata]|uniref:Uncharacterized protein n=1 Tax=Trichonephila clavata TaxID=2740835 RepID=A0A8X6KE42_TRICU|nr:hypothetical protein TNCT_117871 [Trichonephila clavata]
MRSAILLQVSGQNYQNAHLVFVTESNRGVIQQREARTEMARFQCETRNPCAFQPYTLNGLDRELGPIHMSVCYCSPDKVCTRHRDKLSSKMFEFLCYPYRKRLQSARRLQFRHSRWILMFTMSFCVYAFRK